MMAKALGKQREVGQSLLEFALIVPLLILMITVFIDLGRGIFYYSTLNHAVREAARFAIVHDIVDDNPSLAGYQNQITVDVLKDSTSGINTDNINVSLELLTSPDRIRVTATYFFTPVTPGLKGIVGRPGGITLTVRSEMEIAPKYQN